MAGGIITTGSHPKLLWPGIKAIWGQKYAEHKEEYRTLYDVEDSEQAWEEDVQITPFGLAQYKGEGATGYFDTETQGPVTRYTHLAYFLGYKVTYEELSDDLYEKVSTRRAGANAFSMVQTVENVAVVPYNDAFAGAFYLGGDAVSLINTAHPNTTGGTYSNRLSPDADLSEAALEDMCIQIMGVQNDRGLLISIMQRSLHVPRQEWYNANRILKSILQPGTNNNDPNVLKATNAFSGGIEMNHYFTASHAWFVRTNCPEGMKFYWREHPSFAQDNDFDTMNLKARSYMRLSAGNTDPRAIFGSNGP
jgi:hypothetical protein